MPLFSFIIFIFIFIFIIPSSSPAPISTQFLHPNYNSTPFHFVDDHGRFLCSPNSTFCLSFFNPTPQQSSLFYLALVHSPSTSIIWSANPNSPVPSSATFSLSSSSLTLSFPNGTLAWSTPHFPSVAALQLLDSGNLLLLNSSNSFLWQSFEHPTDTLVPGQRLASGSSLVSPASDTDLSDGGYRLFVTDSNAVLRWRGLQQYWSLSADPKSAKDYSSQVAYMEVNATGLSLFDGRNRVVVRIAVQGSDGFRVAKLDSRGRFRVVTYQSGSGHDEFVAPIDNCDLPNACNTLRVCIPGSTNMSTCNCPHSFRPAKGGGCLPSDGSLLAQSSSSCGGKSSSSVEYLSLGSELTYFANKFAMPIKGYDFSSCQDSCSRNCSCVGFFHKNASMACYLVQNQLGSLIWTGSTTNTFFGYVKTIKSSSPSSPNSTSKNIVPILLPLVAALLLLLVLSFVGFRWWRKRSKKKGSLSKLKSPLHQINQRQLNSVAEDGLSDSDEISIPGLPSLFTYDALALATNNFETLIGSGGFGSVYRGELPDKSLIAVKKITNIGKQGKREFITEIAVIGKTHHVNLVKLRGYCAQGSNRMLVFEYMNRGSLDRPLFGHGPTLEWQERMEIAIGAARGLAYLHTGCDHKILHCDIKPENILLADHGQVKISDFGMAKLMSPEQSGLFTTMRGTRGYLAPEWLTNSAISDKTDVYSYGMVLLEIVRGRKNRCTTTVSVSSNSSSGSSGDYFPLIALEKHVEGRWIELADRRMEGRVSETEVKRAVKVALCCLHEEPSMRPGMAAVVGMLEGTMGVLEPKVDGLKFLSLYGRGSGGENEVAVGGRNLINSENSHNRGSLMTNISSQEVSGPR